MWVLLSNELEFEATNVFRSTIGIEAAEQEIGPLSPSHPGLPRKEVLSFAQQPPQTLVQHHCWQRAAHKGAIAHLWRSQCWGTDVLKKLGVIQMFGKTDGSEKEKWGICLTTQIWECM